MSQGQGQGLWNAIGQDGVTTNRQVSIYNDLSVAGNAIFDSSLTARSLYSYYLSVTDNTTINRLSVGGDARFYRPTYFDSLMTANAIRAQLLGAGIIIGDSAQLASVISSFINAAHINGIDIHSTKITAERINTDTVVTVILSCGNARFTGTILASDISAGNLTVTGTSTLHKIIVSDGVTVTSLAGNGQGLIQYDTTGKLTRLDFTNDSNEVLTGSGTFRNINTLIPPADTGWQWVGSDLITTANDVYIPNSLNVGKAISIGPFKIKNGGTRDTIRTAAALAIISDAQNINLEADTVRMPNYVEAPNIRSTQLQVAGDAIISNNLSVGGKIDVGTGTKIISNGSSIDTLRTSKALSVISDAQVIAMVADTVRMKEYTRVGSDTSKYNPPVTGKIALEVAGSATVKGDVAVKGRIAANTIASNDLTISSTISSPKVVTSRITSPDSLIAFGDSSLHMNHTFNRIYGLNSPVNIKGLGLGLITYAYGQWSTALGMWVKTGVNAKHSITMGSGPDNNYLVNDIPYSLMVGFNSDIPTLFVGHSSGAGTTGNVGIGTAAPKEKFQIGDIFTFHDGGNKIMARNFYYDNSTSETKRIVQGPAASIGFGSEGNIELKTWPDKGAGIVLDGYSGLLLLKNDGNVGIGTSNPEKALHIKTFHSFEIGDPPYNPCAPNPPPCPEQNNNLLLGSHGGIRLEEETAITLMGSPQVSANTKWDIVPEFGGLIFSMPGFDEALSIWPVEPADITATNPGSYNMDVNGSVNAKQFSLNGMPLQNLWQTGNSGDIYYNSGNVGIGTNDPQTALQVIGKVSANAFAGNSPLIFEAPIGTERMRIDDVTGNVGIGTTVPTSWGKLHVNGNVVIGSDLTATRITGPGNGGAIEIKSSTATTDRYLRLGRIDNNQVFYPDLTITDGGNVGIGTTSPLAGLHVIPTTNMTGLYVESDFGSNYGFGIISSVTGDNTKALTVLQGGVDKFIVWGNGNVHAPNVYSKHFKVTPNAMTSQWPDWLFYDSSKRMTIAEQAEYFRKYKRLYLMPPAEKVKTDGIEVGEILFGLTYNIEETKLDIVDINDLLLEFKTRFAKQEKRIEKLEKENEDLKKKVIGLKGD